MTVKPRLLSCLCSCVLWGCVADRPVSHLEHASVSLRRVERFEAPQSAYARVVLTPGDFVLTGNGLRVVIGGLSRGEALRGAVLESTAAGVSAAESLVLLALEVYVGGVPRRIQTQRMFILERDKQPTLRIEGSVWVDDRVISCARELSLGRVPGTLSISTRLETLSQAGEANVRVGARIRWGGPRPFMPGVGLIDDRSFQRGELLGVEGLAGSTSFGFTDGSLSVRADFEDSAHGTALLQTHLVSHRVLNLKRAEPAYIRSVLVAASGGLGSTARKLGFARGRPFRELWARVPYHPEGTQVRLVDGSSRPWMSARPSADGLVALPVVPVDEILPWPMFLVASAYGHALSERIPVTLGPGPASVLVIPRGGTMRLRARDAVTGEAIAVRARLTAIEGTTPLELGPDYRASGAKDTVIVLRGDVDLSVPSGRYRVLVTHGPEWSLLDTRFEVTETYSPRVDALLRHEVDPGLWVASDLHVHAEPSPDSEVALDDRLASLEAEGVGFVVPTDHDRVTDYLPTLRELGLTHMLTLPGIEITTTEPVVGHFNAYPMPRDVTRPGNGAPDSVNVEPALLFGLLHSLDPETVVQVNHPRIEGGIGYFEAMSVDPHTGAADPRYSAGFDALEVWNGFDLARPEKFEQVFRDWLALVAGGQRVVATGSSDSHQIRYQLAGYPRTYIEGDGGAGDDPRALVRALRAGRAFVSSGPFIEAHIGDAGPGATASAPGGQATLQVRVRTATWMSVERLEVFVGEACVLDRIVSVRRKNGRAQASAAVVDETLALKLAADAAVVVRVSGATPLDDFFGRNGIRPVAFTNPIFVDVDGDGLTPWSP